MILRLHLHLFPRSYWCKLLGERVYWKLRKILSWWKPSLLLLFYQNYYITNFENYNYQILSSRPSRNGKFKDTHSYQLYLHTLCPINVKAKMGIRKCMAYGIPICFTHLIQAIINHNMNSDTNEWRRLLEVSTTGRSSTLATVSSISSTSEWRKYKPINLRSSKIISYRRSCLWPTGELMLPLWWAQQIELVDGGCS